MLLGQTGAIGGGALARAEPGGFGLGGGRKDTTFSGRGKRALLLGRQYTPVVRTP
jgi:hypothetical protein